MSELSQSFIQHLQQLVEQDRGALATLRRSLSFDPGAYPPAYPYVERFVGAERPADDSFRTALYVVAGLFALHPIQTSCSFPRSVANLIIKRKANLNIDGSSIEKRFIALLGADAENLAVYLRQLVGLLAADDLGFDYDRLLNDLIKLLNLRLDPDQRDNIRSRWARDFYQSLSDVDGDFSDKKSCIQLKV